MITFLPKITENLDIEFTACESDEALGKCIMRIDNNIADVYYLEYKEDKPYVVEGLLRSAYNYASLKNIYMGKCTCRNIDSFLDSMSFEKKNGEYINDIPSILMGSCCKG